MLETARLDGTSDAIQLEFVERVATPIPVMKLAIHLHLVGLSLRKTVIFLENFGVERSRSTVHY
jgi:transposase-like protein